MKQTETSEKFVLVETVFKCKLRLTDQETVKLQSVVSETGTPCVFI